MTAATIDGSIGNSVDGNLFSRFVYTNLTVAKAAYKLVDYDIELRATVTAGRTNYSGSNRLF